MRKAISVLALCSLLLAAMVSCEKEQKEWSKLYGYTQDDLVGQYSYSQSPGAFASLVENENAHLCSDAVVSIAATSEQNITFGLSCPDHNFQRSFSGKPSLMSNAFLISMGSGWVGLKRYALSATVLKNAQNDIRLEGFVSENHYERFYNADEERYDTVLSNSVNYYFDVIKN